MATDAPISAIFHCKRNVLLVFAVSLMQHMALGKNAQNSSGRGLKPAAWKTIFGDSFDR